MKFLKLQVENFMALASAEVELDQRGLVLIQGVNSGDSSAASNGAGKSTLMNSLMWCLYGETAHGVKGDDVLSTGHEKNCRVMVTVEDEGKRYAIIRHRKHKEFKNRLIVRGEDGDMTKAGMISRTFVISVTFFQYSAQIFCFTHSRSTLSSQALLKRVRSSSGRWLRRSRRLIMLWRSSP